MEAGCVGCWRVFFLGGGGFFFRSNGVAPASAPAEASPVSVRSCRDVIHRCFFFFPDTLTGKGGRRVGEGQLESKSYRRRCHVCFLGVSSPSSNKT